MINLSHNKNLNFAFLFSYFLIYNLHATISTLLPEQSPKCPQFTAPLVSKHSDLPQFLTSFLSHPIHCLQLTHAPCIRHFFSIFSFSFFFVIFRKFNVFFLSGLSTLFLFFLDLFGAFLICFFCFFFLILICRIFSRKGKFLQEKLVVEFGWREGAKKINENFVVCFYLSY
mgnify:FL=1